MIISDFEYDEFYLLIYLIMIQRENNNTIMYESKNFKINGYSYLLNIISNISSIAQYTIWVIYLKMLNDVKSYFF